MIIRAVLAALAASLLAAAPADGVSNLVYQGGAEPKVTVNGSPTSFAVEISASQFCPIFGGCSPAVYEISSPQEFTPSGGGCTQTTAGDDRNYTCSPVPVSTTVIGSPQSDTITQAGSRSLFSFSGYNPPLTVTGGAGNDVITGSRGADVLAGQDGDDVIQGGSGNDTISGEAGVDQLDGDGGNDAITGGTEGDTVDGDFGNDTVDGGEGNDTVAGGGDTDTLTAGPGDDVVSGGAGTDTLDGADGADSLDGGAGADGLSGGPGGDLLTGGDDDDALSGGEGRDGLRGGGGNDTLDGDADADALDGGPGGDTLRGGERRDLLIGGEGTDAIQGNADLDTVSYEDRTQSVTVRLDGAANDGVPGEADAIAGDVENVITGPGEDTVVGDAGGNELDTGAGGDTVNPGPGPDFVDGGPGNDAVASRDGVPDRIECADGSDQATTDAFDVAVACETLLASRDLQPDVDNDGIPAPVDCDDRNAARRPGLPDRPGNRIDEDCSGADTAFTRVGTPVQTSFLTLRGRTRVVRFNVLDVPPGATIELRCRGGRKVGCFAGVKRTRHPKGATRVSLTRRFKGVRLRRRAVAEVRILDADQIGKVVRYTAQSGRRVPKSTLLCFRPGARAPARC